MLTRPELIKQMHAAYFEAGVDAVETATFGAFSLVNDKSIRSLSVGLTYERSDRLLGGGYANASLTAVLGELVLDTQRQRDDDDQGLRSRGRFAHWNYAASRLNALTPTLNLFLDVYNIFISLLQLLLAFTGQRD